jgi:hypothetical protein
MNTTPPNTAPAALPAYDSPCHAPLADLPDDLLAQVDRAQHRLLRLHPRTLERAIAPLQDLLHLNLPTRVRAGIQSTLDLLAETEEAIEDLKDRLSDAHDQEELLQDRIEILADHLDDLRHAAPTESLEYDLELLLYTRRTAGAPEPELTTLEKIHTAIRAITTALSTH